MNYPIEEIEGIGPTYGAKLKAIGIATTGALLKKGATPAGRKAICESADLAHERVLDWVNLADLMRVNGIGKQFSELLEAAGIDTIKELRNRNAANTAAKMAEINAEKKLTRAVPSEKRVQAWIDQAKTMEPAVSY